MPYAFIELGVAMLSSVLNSDRAVQMNIVIMRAFVKLREILATNKALAQRIEHLTSTTKMPPLGEGNVFRWYPGWPEKR